MLKVVDGGLNYLQSRSGSLCAGNLSRWGILPNQCDPSDRDRNLVCCFVETKIVTDFLDLNGDYIPVKYTRVILGMVTSRPGV